MKYIGPLGLFAFGVVALAAFVACVVFFATVIAKDAQQLSAAKVEEAKAIGGQCAEAGREFAECQALCDARLLTRSECISGYLEFKE